ncbi:MAG: response regulator [Chloroflexota bacterium]
MLDTESSRNNPTGKLVVVVEDDPSIAVLIATTLESAGYLPRVVQDGRRALQVVRELQPDVITLDLELPGLDGRAVLRRLCAETPEDALPVVVVSGSISLLSRDERRLVARLLPKPFSINELIEAVDAVAERSAS